MSLLIDTKPTLEWVTKTEKEYKYRGPLSKSTNGEYMIQRIIDEYHVYGLHWIDPIDSGHKSLPEAKAAAQADYERRTAERFVRVELPEPIAPYYGLYKTDYMKGQHAMYELIIAAIDRAKEGK